MAARMEDELSVSNLLNFESFMCIYHGFHFDYEDAYSENYSCRKITVY
jgi:hypothetical protein